MYAKVINFYVLFCSQANEQQKLSTRAQNMAISAAADGGGVEHNYHYLLSAVAAPCRAPAPPASFYAAPVLAVEFAAAPG